MGDGDQEAMIFRKGKCFFFYYTKGIGAHIHLRFDMVRESFRI